MFFGMRRFDDLREVRAGDVAILEDGDLEIFVVRSKIDQDGLGFVFTYQERSIRGFQCRRYSDSMWTTLVCQTAIIYFQGSVTQGEARSLLRANTVWGTAQWLLSLKASV